jgi:hypothetical protein
MHEVYRVLPKRLAEPIGRLVAFLQSIGTISQDDQSAAG